MCVLSRHGTAVSSANPAQSSPHQVPIRVEVGTMSSLSATNSAMFGGISSRLLLGTADHVFQDSPAIIPIMPM